MAILSRGCQPDNFESHNSLKLSFTNTRGLCLNFGECESFLESNSHDILALCETNLDDSINTGNFSVKSCFPFYAPFHCIVYDYSHADWDGFCYHLRDVPWKDFFKPSAPAAASEFCEWVQFVIDVYILHHKYWVKTSLISMVHRNYFFLFVQTE